MFGGAGGNNFFFGRRQVAYSIGSYSCRIFDNLSNSFKLSSVFNSAVLSGSIPAGFSTA
jgi:hypothetical protein